MPTKERQIKTYEVGVKNRKPFTIRADKFNGGGFDADLKFHLNGQLVYIIHRHKWDYVRLIDDAETSLPPIL
jgi:hypothetical protein